MEADKDKDEVEVLFLLKPDAGVETEEGQMEPRTTVMTPWTNTETEKTFYILSATNANISDILPCNAQKVET